MAETKKGTNSTKAIIAGVCAAAVVVTGGALYATGVIGSEPEEESAGLKYETQGVMILEDSGGVYDVLEPDSVALEFKNDAYSKDGKTFTCYLGNSALNERDMFVAIYADVALTEELYVSGLVPPGSGFEEITLDQELEEGDHRVYIAFTQMDDPETIHGQTLYTMDFHVIPD